MTLYKQMILVMSIIVLLLLATAMFVNYKNAEGFIKDQLYSNAANTASSLGVAIGNADGDKAMQETLINAVFDSGYYEKIELSDIDGNIVYQSKEPVKVEGVPHWFIAYVHLSASEAVVTLSSGWKQIGHLKIIGHRGHAYMQIWDAFREMIFGFITLGIVALLGIYMLLKLLLQPLQRVREQAEGVLQRRFIYQKELPKTQEMHDVVTAMNSLVSKVKSIYEREAQAIAKYKRLLYEDRETGYYNRDYLRIKLQGYLNSHDHFSHGYIAAFTIHNYPKLLEEKGTNGVHKAVMDLRDMIDHTCMNIHIDKVCCRTRESDIMIIIPASLERDVEKLVQNVCQSPVEDFKIDATYVPYKEGESLVHIMERIDHGLMMAASMDSDSHRYYSDGKDDVPLLSHDEWIETVQIAMDEHAFIPMLQTVVKEGGEPVHHEFLLRLQYKDRIISAGLFMPIIAGVNMLSDLDRHVLEELVSYNLTQPLAVNLTYDFISHSASLHLITELTKRWRENCMDIIFELPNAALAKDPDTCKVFASHIQREGWRLGIDHFTVDAYDLQLLEALKPAYLKINASYLLSLIENQQEEMSSSSLFILTELLEIDIIAIAVDSEVTQNRLNDNGIRYMQGFWISEPKEERKR